ncbi:alkaline phosphatase family protein [Halobacteriales archaeon Cl-PHB]
MTHTTRTLVVGFDALDFEFLDRFADSLANFERLRQRGVEAPLESTHPPWTGSAWPSMYTGTDPSYHGVYDFFVHDGYPDDARLATRTDVDRPALWNYLTHDGGESVVLNVPVTHPAEDIEGALVPGYLATEDAEGSPTEIRSELSAAIGEPYTIYSRAETASQKDERLAGYLDLIDQRARAARALLTTRPWELGFVQVQKTDTVFHHFDSEQAFRDVYEAADAFLGTVLDAVDGQTNVVVCSDHGIGHKNDYAIYVNEILREHGFVEGTKNGSGSELSAVKTALTGEESSDGGESDSEGLVTRATTAALAGLARSGLSPAGVYDTAQRLGLGQFLDARLPSAIKDATAQTVDWRNSRAYCRSSAELGVRINLEGREPNGVVPQSEYESVRDDLVPLLQEAQTPDGRPAFEQVVRREAVYEGPHADEACDVLFVPNGMNHTIGTKLYGRQFVSMDLYDHEREGVLLAAGPDIDATADVQRASLTDVAPLVMALLDRPVPERMTGRVPAGLVDGPVERRDYGDVPFGTGDATAGREDEVTDRLEDLGYI